MGGTTWININCQAHSPAFFIQPGTAVLLSCVVKIPVVFTSLRWWWFWVRLRKPIVLLNSKNTWASVFEIAAGGVEGSQAG